MRLILLSLILTAVSALRFNLEANSNGNMRCIRDFVGSEALVVLDVKTSGNVGDGQKLALTVSDDEGNTYFYRDSISNRVYQTFSPSAGVGFDMCFTNTLTNGNNNGNNYREIELDVLIGSSARDWKALEASEKLKPTELLLRQLSDKVQELYADLEYMQHRESRLRDTNESTNQRVKNFFLIIMVSLFGLGAWQIAYLRSYFRSKHII